MTEQNLLIILGNQLFPLEEISKINSNTVFMKEDYNFCTDFKHHKLKILMFFLAMRDYRDCLKKKGYNVIYHSIEDSSFKKPYLDVLGEELSNKSYGKINYFEIIDKPFEKKFNDFISKSDFKYHEHQSPMFLYKKDFFTKSNSSFNGWQNS